MGTDCPERWWMVCSWKHGRSGGMGLWAMWSPWRCPCLLQGGWTRRPWNILSSSNYSMIPPSWIANKFYNGCPEIEELSGSRFLKMIHLNNMLYVTKSLLKGKGKVWFPWPEVLCLDHKAFYSASFHFCIRHGRCQMPILMLLWLIFIANPSHLLAEAKTAEKKLRLYAGNESQFVYINWRIKFCVSCLSWFKHCFLGIVSARFLYL